MRPALRATSLVLHRGGREVVHELDLDLHAGEVVALLGPNGAGKSTLVAALAGLLAPTSGSVERDGRVASALQIPAMARRSALENVEAALGWWGVERRRRRERALDALERVGATHLADQPAGTLSGGEARRVHLARVIAVDPDVLLLDEPFAGLDTTARADLIDDTASALRNSRRAVLVVVHDRAEAWALADRLIVLLAGRIAASGPPGDVLERPPDRAVAEFLGFTGHLTKPDGSVRLLRPAHVRVAHDGDVRARVVRRIPTEDGVRLVLDRPDGSLTTVTSLPGPAVGDDVGLRLTGGVSFPGSPGGRPRSGR